MALKILQSEAGISFRCLSDDSAVVPARDPRDETKFVACVITSLFRHDAEQYIHPHAFSDKSACEDFCGKVRAHGKIDEGIWFYMGR